LGAEARQLAEQLIPKRMITAWESKVIKRFAGAGISLEIKSRIFPLYDTDGNEFIYIPDFTIMHHSFKGKKIIVEANEDLTERDIPMYASFMRDRSNSYHLIFVVTENQLRLWNSVGDRIFDEIWTIDDMAFLIDSLKRYRIASSIQTETGKPKPSSVQNSFSKTYQCIGCKREFVSADPSQTYCDQCLTKFSRST
jgi:hypothetical protein